MSLRPESRSSYGEVLKEAIGEAGANVHVHVASSGCSTR